MGDTSVAFEASVTSVTGRGGRLNSYTPANNGPGGSPGGGASPLAGSNSQLNGACNQKRFDEDVNLPLIKVVVLGAPGVGKTSVVKVHNFKKNVFF